MLIFNGEPLKKIKIHGMLDARRYFQLWSGAADAAERRFDTQGASPNQFGHCHKWRPLSVLHHTHASGFRSESWAKGSGHGGLPIAFTVQFSWFICAFWRLAHRHVQACHFTMRDEILSAEESMGSSCFFDESNVPKLGHCTEYAQYHSFPPSPILYQ